MPHITRPSQRTPAPPSRARLLLMHHITTLAALPALLAAPAALLTGCIFVDGTSSGSSMSGGGSSMTSGSGMTSGGSSMDMPTAPIPRLPQPDVWRVELPVLDADAQKRLDEIEQYVAEQYQAAGWQIVATTQSFVGDLYDWIDVNSIEGSQEEPPPPPTAEELQLPDGVLLQLTELDAFSELRGPEGTVPVLRPSFAAYVLGLSGAPSLEDFLTSYVVPGAPPPYDKNRLYAGMFSRVDNQGANVTINSYAGWIEPFTMSVLEMLVGCRDPNNPVSGEMWQQIGIASSRNWTTWNVTNVNDSVLRLQVEFLTAGPTSLGDSKDGHGHGGWVGANSVTDFIPAKGAPYGPGAAFAAQTISTVSGPQYESLYQIKRLDNGNWWVGHNGYWLGYFPAKLFGESPSNLLASKACEVHWYGEVYDATPENWTWTDMGSGRFASEGWGNAAYFRDPSYVSLDAAGTWAWPPSDPGVTSDILPNLYNDKCYTKTPLGSGPAPWEQFFYVSGPGREGDGDACTGPISPP